MRIVGRPISLRTDEVIFLTRWSNGNIDIVLIPFNQYTQNRGGGKVFRRSDFTEMMKRWKRNLSNFQVPMFAVPSSYCFFDMMRSENAVEWNRTYNFARNIGNTFRKVPKLYPSKWIQNSVMLMFNLTYQANLRQWSKCSCRHVISI